MNIKLVDLDESCKNKISEVVSEFTNGFMNISDAPDAMELTTAGFMEIITQIKGD